MLGEAVQRILVAGSSGQVAQALKDQALKEASAEGKRTLETFGRPAFDLCDVDGMRHAIEVFQPSAIVNAAAYTAVDAAETDEKTAFSINCDGAAALAALAAEQDIPFIHLSTDYVFSGGKTGAYSEDDETGPSGAYGRSKLAGEQAILASAAKAIILRTAWVYGPHGKNFLKTMLALAETRDTLSVVADQTGNPTYAPHIADAVLRILDRITATGWRDEYRGIYHLAGTGTVSWHGFAEEIFARSAALGGKHPKVKAIATAEFPTPARRPANSQLDCGKIERIFGIVMPPWQEGVTSCLSRLFPEQQTVHPA